VNSTLISIVAVILLAGATFAGPIHDAALNGDLAGVQAELDKGVDVNAKGEEGWTPLHSAATKEIAELLIAKGADVNAKSDDGTTPLDVAIELKRTGIVNLFRKHGGKTGEELKTESK
jgi:ankyrin repeat protein